MVSKPEKDKNGYLSQCHDFIDPQPYYENCLFDLCQSGANSACGIFDLYISACSSHTGKTYCDWSEKLGCGQKCGKHSHWSGCASICRDVPTCDEPDKEYLGKIKLFDCLTYQRQPKYLKIVPELTWSPECVYVTMDMLWKEEIVSESPTVDVSLKMDHEFQTDSHKCHVTVRSCVNVLTATGTANSIIVAEIRFANRIQIIISSVNAIPAVKARFHQHIFTV